MPARIRGTVSDVPDFEYESGGTWFDYDTRPADFNNTATGTYSSSGTNYKFVRFTSSGTLTVTRDGLADILIAGGGGAAWSGSSNGQPGGVEEFTTSLFAGTYSIVVGTGGSGVNGHGGATTFGTFRQPGGLGGGNYAGAGAFSLTSSITGSSVTYGGQTTGNGTPANTGGGGGSPSGAWAGSAGVVIVRVKV